MLPESGPSITAGDQTHPSLRSVCLATFPMFVLLLIFNGWYLPPDLISWNLQRAIVENDLEGVEQVLKGWGPGSSGSPSPGDLLALAVVIGNPEMIELLTGDPNFREPRVLLQGVERSIDTVQWPIFAFLLSRNAPVGGREAAELMERAAVDFRIFSCSPDERLARPRIVKSLVSRGAMEFLDSEHLMGIIRRASSPEVKGLLTETLKRKTR